MRTRLLAALTLAACAPAGVPDPRTELIDRLPERCPTCATHGWEGLPLDEALRSDQPAVACAAALAGVRAAAGSPGRAGEDDAWTGLLRAAARSPGCAPDDVGARLVAWAMDPAAPARHTAWRGAAAEWAAAHGRVAEAQAWLAAPGEDGARMRVALAAHDDAAAAEAAEGALLADPRDVLACRLVAGHALARGDVLGALEAARCGGERAQALLRVEADALARAELWTDAAGAYQAAGANVHAAAILYQQVATPDARARASALLAAGHGPAEALHRGWLALLAGERVPADVLAAAGRTPPAAHLRAVAEPYRLSPEDRALLEGADHARAKVALARSRAATGDRAGALAALDAARALDPASEPVNRASVALRVALGLPTDAALAAWAALDPDHVRLRGASDDREVPWAALAPWSWREACGATRDPRCAADAPRGADAVGAAWREAAALPPAQRLEAIAALQARAPDLPRLAAERWQRAAPDPTRPLDAPLPVE
jgi:hypothetical protein